MKIPKALFSYVIDKSNYIDDYSVEECHGHPPIHNCMRILNNGRKGKQYTIQL